MTAREYSGRNAKFYDCCAWIDYNNSWKESLIAALGYRMKEQGTTDEIYRKLVFTLQNQPGRKLMVLDNLSDPSEQQEARQQQFPALFKFCTGLSCVLNQSVDPAA